MFLGAQSPPRQSQSRGPRAMIIAPPTATSGRARAASREKCHDHRARDMRRSSAAGLTTRRDAVDGLFGLKKPEGTGAVADAVQNAGRLR